MKHTLPRSYCIFFAVVFFASFSAISSHAQTDAAISLYGAFTGTTEANGTVQSPSNSAGFMLELGHISNPLVGYELTYSFNRANQSYNFDPVKANAQQVAADWILSLPILNFKPFILGGLGLGFFNPDESQPGVSRDTKPVYIYGAGLDWTVLPHLGLRGQYRGNLYHAPDLLNAASSTHSFTHTSEPMLGGYLRFWALLQLI